jgi:uncharacterized FAD-dependent dehydrogenase
MPAGRRFQTPPRILIVWESRKLPVIISNIRLPLGAQEGEALSAAKAELKKISGPAGAEINSAYIVKRSPDLRHRSSPAIVYTVGAELADFSAEEKLVLRAASQSVTLRRRTQFSPAPGSEKPSGRPVIVGFGPAGMFAGLLLSHMGYAPIIIERGADVDTRVNDVAGFWRTGKLDCESNVQFGEGGAGTFSDGKLVTRINDPLCDTVLKEFVAHGAPQSVMTAAKPHVGTDKLRLIVKSIRCDIIAHGGEVRFGEKLEGLKIKSGTITGAVLSGGVTLPASAVILAVGHSARDTFAMLASSGVTLVPKPFSAGVRIEHLQSDVDLSLYGALAGHPNLPRGEYQLSHREGGRAVYTFCMCPGGSVVAAASETGGVVTNGMSMSDRGGTNANSALVTSIDAFAEPFEGIEFQRKLEKAAFAAGGGDYRAPCQTVGAFMEGTDTQKFGRVRPTYPAGTVPARFDRLLPEQMTAQLRKGIALFSRKLSCFGAPDALLTGVETRTSSPVRIPRSAGFTAPGADGLYPAGEGAGYAGGIVSAAVDGLRAAAAVIERYSPK